jgi:phosphohistidine swiveling domain-containing protein
MYVTGMANGLPSFTGIPFTLRNYININGHSFSISAEHEQFVPLIVQRLSEEGYGDLLVRRICDALTELPLAVERSVRATGHGDLVARHRAFVAAMRAIHPFSYLWYNNQTLANSLIERSGLQAHEADMLFHVSEKPYADQIRLAPAVVRSRFARASPSSLPLLTFVLQNFVIKTWRAKAWQAAESAILPLLEEVGARLGIDVANVHCLTAEEIEQSLQGADFSALAQERKRRWAVFYIDGEMHILQGNDIPSFGAGSKKDEAELGGRAGCAGVARGTARIIRNAQDVARFAPGEIFVAEMTYPSQIAALKHAAAIVTRRGGLLCHAAIIGRELGIPTVFGVANALECIKDGDMIEVNANEGIVRKL